MHLSALSFVARNSIHSNKKTMRDVKRFANSKDLCDNMNCSLINFWLKKGMPQFILLDACVMHKIILRDAPCIKHQIGLVANIVLKTCYVSLEAIFSCRNIDDRLLILQAQLVTVVKPPQTNYFGLRISR